MWALLFCGFIAADVAVGVLASRVAFESLLQARVRAPTVQPPRPALALHANRPWQPSP